MALIQDTTHRVLLAGATGLVGSELLRLLANDPQIKELRTLVRRPLPPDKLNPRVLECRINFEMLDQYPELFAVDWVFCALGTTIRQAGSQENFRKVDYDYPLVIAKNARAQGASHFLLVSALGAEPHSRIFYNRVKGELEEAIQALGYPAVTIVRPSLLLGEREEQRRGEEIAKRFTWIMPARYKPVPATQVAAALVRAAHARDTGVDIVNNARLIKEGKR